MAFQEAPGSTAERRAFCLATKAQMEIVSSEDAKKTLINFECASGI